MAERRNYGHRDHTTAKLVSMSDNAQCSRCTEFRANGSFCALKKKLVKWYNKCEHFKGDK